MGFSRWQWWPGPIHSTVPGVTSAPLTSTMTASELATHMRSFLRTPASFLRTLRGIKTSDFG